MQFDLTAKLPVGGEYNLMLELYGEVIPEKTRMNVFGTKIEVELTKKDAIKWAALEGDGQETGAPAPAVIKLEDTGM